MEKKNFKVLLIVLLSLLVLLIIAAVKFNIFKKFGFKKSNQLNFNATVTNNVNPGQGEKYEKIVDGVSISFIKLNGWKYEELPATEEYKFALKFYKNSSDKYAVLYFYNNVSGVCGTDRKEQVLNLNNGNKVNVGYSTDAGYDYSSLKSIYKDDIDEYVKHSEIHIGQFWDAAQRRSKIEKIYKITNKIILVQLLISIVLFFVL